MVLGDSGSGNLNLGRRRGGEVDRSVGEGTMGEVERRIGGEETRSGEEEERLRGGAVFLAMQVLKISAGGRGFPLVSITRGTCREL